MVNKNFVFYGDRKTSDSVIPEPEIETKTDRKMKRKMNRTANELQVSLNQAQLDNDTDSVKYEKCTKEPKLLRYAPNSDLEENYVSDQFQTYDTKPAQERSKRFTFTKKPKNPADGSINYAYYAYSRDSSACSSPNTNLPTISELTEHYDGYRVHPRPSAMGKDLIHSYESKLERYLSKQRDVDPFADKGSHPDSLFRVQQGGNSRGSRLGYMVRVLRWPVALISICVALAVFVYLLMPENMDSNLRSNETFWEQQQQPVAAGVGLRELPNKGNRPREIDFQDSSNNINRDLTQNKDQGGDLTVIPPVFPTHLLPEVQYGNEQADSGKRKHKVIIHLPDRYNDYNHMPHFTQKPEKPLAVYFEEDKDDAEIVTTETTARTGKYVQDSNNINKIYLKNLPESDLYSSDININSNVNFTSSHSKFFGISIEDAARMKTTTQNALYNTRVSPTLPTWRDGDDSTTKTYSHNIYSEVQCKSTHLPLCREILPYDLAGAAVKFGDVEITSMMPQIDYLIATNCSDRIKHFVCALLEPECSPPPLPTKLPCYNLCKAIVDNCDGHIPRELTLAFDCKMYSHTSCVEARAPCYHREYTCNDGSCIPEDWLCDGRKDCAAGDDEHKCKQCDSSEFRCPGGGCIQNTWTCDGYKDCAGGEDESELKCGTREVLALDQNSDEPGEETAGSAYVPAIKRPEKHNNGRRKSSGAPKKITEANESSEEILVRSYSDNPITPQRTYSPPPERQITPRRSTPSHFTGQSKKIQQKPFTTTEPRPRTHKKPPPEHERKINFDNESNEGGKTEDMTFFDEFNSKSTDSKRRPGAPTPESKPAPQIMPSKNPTQLSLGNPKNVVELVVDGATLMKNAQEAEAAEAEGLANLEKEDFASDFKPQPHGSPCPSGELRCVDGHCITLAQLCDGTVDCSDHADEDNCYT